MSVSVTAGPTPKITCRICGRAELVSGRHLRAEFPPDSARRALRKLCKEHCTEEDLVYTAGLRFGGLAQGM